MKRNVISVLLALALIVTCFTPATYAAAKGSTKKMTVYDDVIKSGNYAYCSTPKGIYKVNIKTRKAKRIVKLSQYDEEVPICMALKGKYLYYLYGEGDGIDLNRVKTNGKYRKTLAVIFNAYAIKGKKIYYDGYGKGEKEGKWVCKLNGSSKKKTSIRAKNTVRDSNKKGYRLVDKKDKIVYDDYYEAYVTRYKAYLKTPKKTIYLCSYVVEDVEDSEYTEE